MICSNVLVVAFVVPYSCPPISILDTQLASSTSHNSSGKLTRLGSHYLG